jgi:site-specific recombinase XerD
MQETPLRFAKAAPQIPVAELARYAQDWLLDGEIRQLSRCTLDARRFLVDKLLWFFREREYGVCGKSELRAFLHYLSTGHGTGTGRWGNERMTKGLRPRTVQTYFGNLRTFFRFLVKEEVIETSPLESMAPPVARKDQVQPFTHEQIEAHLAAARRSRHPRRDEAIVLFLLDTGCRASELCGLKMKDLDLHGYRCTVLGKGNKTRTLRFSRDTRKALYSYLREEEREDAEPVFTADRGKRAGEPLTRSGLLQLIERLGKAARIEACRCSPHTFRHTFAVEFLRAGGNVFTLKELLGHTTLAMVNRYVALADADIENQHRQFSPVERMRARRR